MILKWSKKLNNQKENYYFLKISDFAESFGTTEKEVKVFCEEIFNKKNFKYQICNSKIREEIFLDIIKKLDNNEFSVSGAHRQNDWKKGWREIFDEFKKSKNSLKILIPKDIHGNRPLRYKGNYIISDSNSFEHDFSLIFRTWLFKKYFLNFKNIYEFGCGSGHNLVVLAKIFPDKNFFGTDWAEESKHILSVISKKYGWNIKGSQFDFFNPDYNLKILPNSLVYTSAALEQLGKNYRSFVNYLIAQKSKLCVNVECISEYYNPDILFDYLSLKYHKKRNYLDGYLTYLYQLEKQKKIKIIATKRLGFGSLYHEVFSYIIWQIL